MATSDIKNTAQSALRDTKSTLRDASNPSSMHEASNQIGERIDSLKDTAQNLTQDATPRVKEVYNQFNDAASDLYSRANGWLKEGNNKNYGFMALAGLVGVIGFFVGRATSNSSSEF